jgi:hypothetical protein
MSKPTQWTTTYSSVFRDRRKYEAPNAAPSDDSWSVRTQAYYGPRAALSEHAARTAEIEARTQYGAIVPNETATGGRYLAPTSTQGLGAAGLNLNGSGPQSAFGGPASPVSTGTVRYAHPTRDLWTTPILPHTGVVQEASPSYGASTQINGAYTQRPTFTNGYNNGYATEYQFQEQFSSQPMQPAQQPPVPQSHIPGYSGFVRGSQFVHGDTFGKTTRSVCNTIHSPKPMQLRVELAAPCPMCPTLNFFLSHFFAWTCLCL